MKNNNIKICLTASAGGHISQLLTLSKAWQGHEIFYVTTTETVRKKLEAEAKVYVVGESNRQHPIRVLKVFARCINIIFSERPNVIISTGAAAGCILCFLGKLTGSKIIWMDSITNVQHLSLSGRMVRYIADIFLVQWPDLAQRYKNAEYAGHVI